MDSQIILKNKQARIILALRDTTQNWYIASLAKVSETTYVHACNFINTCESLGVVSSEKHGKTKSIKLTEKGMKIADAISNITMMMGQPQAQQPQQEQKS
jgi:predicted transcriptional regulator